MSERGTPAELIAEHRAHMAQSKHGAAFTSDAQRLRCADAGALFVALADHVADSDATFCILLAGSLGNGSRWTGRQR